MDEQSKRRKVVLVTGGTGGIGVGIAESLMARGFDVVLTDRSDNAQRLEELGDMAKNTARLHYIKADIADLDGQERLLDEAFSAFGQIDVLVNSAGVSVLSRGDLLEVSRESYDLNFDVNARAAFFLAQKVAKRMLRHENVSVESERSIFFISSSNAAIAAPERGEYAMSKAAISMMAKLYALRLAPHGISVYEIRPGLIKTPMTGVAEARFERLLEKGFTPFNRWGLPSDVGRAIATLAAGELPFMTGSAIEIDGGMHIHHY